MSEKKGKSDMWAKDILCICRIVYTHQIRIILNIAACAKPSHHPSPHPHALYKSLAAEQVYHSLPSPHMPWDHLFKQTWERSEESE